MTFYYLTYYFCSVLFSAVLSLIIYQVTKRKWKGPRAVFLSAVAFTIPFLIHMMSVTSPLRLALLLVLLLCLAFYAFAFYVAWDHQRDIRLFRFNESTGRRRTSPPKRAGSPAFRVKDLKKRMGDLASQVELAAGKLSPSEAKASSSDSQPLSGEPEAILSKSEPLYSDVPEAPPADRSEEEEESFERDLPEDDQSKAEAAIFSVSEFVDSTSSKLKGVIEKETGRSVSSGQSKSILITAAIVGVLILAFFISNLGSSGSPEPYDPYDVYHNYDMDVYQYSALSDVNLTQEMLSQGADQCARTLGFTDFQQLALQTSLPADSDWELLICEQQFDRYAAYQGLPSYDEMLYTQDPYSKKSIMNYLGYMDYCAGKLLQRSGQLDVALQRSYQPDSELTRQRFDQIARILGFEGLEDCLKQYAYDSDEYGQEEALESIANLLAGFIDAMPYYEALDLYDPDQGFLISNLGDYQLFLINSARHHMGLPLPPLGKELEEAPASDSPDNLPEAGQPDGVPAASPPEVPEI